MLQYPNPSVSGAHLEFRQRSLVHQSHGLWPSEKWPVIRQKPLAGKCLPAPFHTSCSINLSIAAGGVQKNTHFLHVICGLKVCCNIYYQKDASLAQICYDFPEIVSVNGWIQTVEKMWRSHLTDFSFSFLCPLKRNTHHDEINCNVKLSNK